MYTPEEIIAGCQALRPHLKTLLGEEAEGMDNELRALLDQAQAGQRVEGQLLQIVARYTVTRTWLTDYLKEKQNPLDEANRLKSLDLLPGNNTALPLPLFRCPQGDYEWSRPSVGIPVPQCPSHHIDLIRIS